MPVFQFGLYSFADLGIPPLVFGMSTFPPVAQLIVNPGSTFTAAVTVSPDQVNVDDDEPNFEDEIDDTFSGTGDVGDPGLNQILTQDIVLDGSTVATTGQYLFNVIAVPVNNITTGETGTMFMVVALTNQPTGTAGTATLGDVIGLTSDIWVNPGDQVTYSATSPIAASPYVDLICFVAGTQIETESGMRAIEDLKVGDCVRTKKDGLAPIRYLGRREISSIELMLNPHLRPIEISPSSGLLPGLTRAIRVSPQHKFVVSSAACELHFNTSEVFVTAKSMLGRPGVKVVEDFAPVEYLHIALDEHEVIFAEGVATESLYLGPDYKRFHTQEAQRELEALFPELEADTPDTAKVACLPTLKPKEVSLVV